MLKAMPTAMLAVIFALVSFSANVHAVTAQVVDITLLDASADPSISGMVMKVSTANVKAGRVSLQAVNQSKSLVHEVLVIPAPAAGKKIPYDERKDTVVETRVHSLGEIAELKPGARGRLTLNLKPGKYLLLCNQPGHYKSGMSTELVVEK